MNHTKTCLSYFTNPENSHGLEFGDMIRIRKTGNLVRYIGVAYGGIPNTPYNKKLLQFSQGFPVHPFNQINQNLAKTYYLVTEESSSQGFIEPSTIKGLKNLEKISFLNEDIKDIKKDFDKVGNIPQYLWELMERESPR